LQRLGTVLQYALTLHLKVDRVQHELCGLGWVVVLFAPCLGIFEHILPQCHRVLSILPQSQGTQHLSFLSRKVLSIYPSSVAGYSAPYSVSLLSVAGYSALSAHAVVWAFRASWVGYTWSGVSRLTNARTQARKVEKYDSLCDTN